MLKARNDALSRCKGREAECEPGDGATCGDEVLRGDASCRQDGGFVLALTTLLLIPLLLFAGFATDLGSWYYTASKVQRAADAAALAGVVWLPDEDAAVDAAREAAAHNGYEHGVDGVTVEVTRVGGEQLEVRIGEPVEQFFTQLVMDRFTVRRSSTAEYVLPVPLGSPTNTLGTGNLGDENFWLAASGRCASKENGDLLLPVTGANFSSISNPPPATGNPYANCLGGNTVPNQDYDPRGYYYAINLAANSSYDVEVQVYDASRRRCEPSGGRGCRDGNAAYFTGDTVGDGETSWNAAAQTWAGGRRTTTTYVLGDRVVGFDYRASPAVATLVAENNDGSYQGRWTTVGILRRPTRGIYPLQVFTGAAEAGRASNSFAIRAVPIGAPSSSCTTIQGESDYLASCPQVHGLEWMSIMANLTDAASGTGQASFYLADVGDQHAGKVMEISLWDPGEGAQRIEVLDPAGNPVPFRWEVECPTGVIQPDGGCSGGPGLSVDVSGSGLSQPGPYRASSSRYSDRMLRLLVDVPSDFSPYGDARWWKIRYTVAGSPTDRTTWGVRILGDPVRIIPNS